MLSLVAALALSWPRSTSLRPLAPAGLKNATPSIPPLAHRSPQDATISSGKVFLDLDGQPVYAHSGAFIMPESHPAGTSDGAYKYYLVGASQKRGANPQRGDKLELQQGDYHFQEGEYHSTSEAVNMYSSYDLEQWKFEGAIFHASQLQYTYLWGAARIERPKVIYNNRTGAYVLYFHTDDEMYTRRLVAVAKSDTVNGEYTLVRTFQPDNKPSLDLGLFQDEDGSAWLVRSVDNSYVGFSRLSDDYLNTTGVVANASLCEAVSLWREEEYLYLLCSHLTGWYPNPAILQRAHAPVGQIAGATWTVLGNPTHSENSFRSQVTYVLPYTHLDGRRLLIYIADRWNLLGTGSIENASYVWLPLMKNDTDPCGFVVPPLGNGTGTAEWRIDDYGW